MLNSSVPISSIFYYSVHLFSSSFPFSSLLCLLIFHLLYAFFFLMSSPLIFSLYHLLTSAFSTDSPPSCLCFPLQRRGRTAWVPTPEASRTPAPSATRTTVSTETASTPTASHLPPAGTERQGGRERKEGGKEGGESERRQREEQGREDWGRDDEGREREGGKGRRAEREKEIEDREKPGEVPSYCKGNVKMFSTLNYYILFKKNIASGRLH